MAFDYRLGSVVDFSAVDGSDFGVEVLVTEADEPVKTVVVYASSSLMATLHLSHAGWKHELRERAVDVVRTRVETPGWLDERRDVEIVRVSMTADDYGD